MDNKIDVTFDIKIHEAPASDKTTSSTIDNKIDPSQRFAKKNNQEYSVFSTTISDASSTDRWVGIDQPHHVLMDPNTFDELRNRRIQWVFNEDSEIIACKITES
jgi:hypothetical protein